MNFNSKQWDFLLNDMLPVQLTVMLFFLMIKITMAVLDSFRKNKSETKKDDEVAAENFMSQAEKLGVKVGK